MWREPPGTRTGLAQLSALATTGARQTVAEFRVRAVLPWRVRTPPVADLGLAQGKNGGSEIEKCATAPTRRKKKKKKKASPLPHRQSSACSSPPPRYSAMLRTLKPTLLLLLTVQTSTTSGRSTVHWCRAVHQRAYGQRRRVDSEGKCICSGGKKKYCPCWDGCAHARQLHFVPTEPVLTWSFPQSCRILEFYLTWLAPFRVPGKHTRLLLCYPNADMQSDFIRGRRNRYRSDGWVGLMASL